MIKYVLKLPDNAEQTTPVVSPVFTRSQARTQGTNGHADPVYSTPHDTKPFVQFQPNNSEIDASGEEFYPLVYSGR